MAQICGKYQLEKNENIDEYFRAIGVPYIARKMIVASSPAMEIAEIEGKWSIKTISLLRTNETAFKLDEEYDESMPGGILKTITTREGDKIISSSTAEDATKISRIYDFNDTHCVITMSHEKSGQVAKRHFKRM